LHISGLQYVQCFNIFSMKFKALIFIIIGIVIFGLKQDGAKTINELKVAVMQESNSEIVLFLCGDVMTGRGIDQALPFPCKHDIYEPYVKDARDYITIAERQNGEINYPVGFKYIWGDALEVFEQFNPDLKIINLETSITTNDSYWPGKGIQYRMNPKNTGCLSVLGNLYCALSNNHILDWNEKGLIETISTLNKAGIHNSGAGINAAGAIEPSIIELKKKGRVIVLSYGMPTSGIPANWSAGEDSPGVNILEDYSNRSVQKIRAVTEPLKQPGDIVVLSLHWGSNWGYEIHADEMEFVHKLIDKAHIDIFHGHSSHHFKAIEVYNNKLILYGCGDFINDYEGIGGKESYRSDIALMYFARIVPNTGNLAKLEIVPMQIRNFRLNKVRNTDLLWVKYRLESECERFCISTDINKERLELKW